MTSDDLLLAILSMESYDLGYSPGIDVQSQIGAATVLSTTGVSQRAQADDFYAVAFSVRLGTP